MDDDDRILSGMHDPEWAKRVADIEKEFRKAERRKRAPKSATAPTRRPRRFRTAYIWAVIVIGVIAFAAIVKPWGVQGGGVPVANQPDPILTRADGAIDSGSATTVASVASAAVASASVGTSAPSTTDSTISPHQGPFAASPAALWPTADKGVIMPPAKAVGPYSAAEVKHSLDVAHQYLLTARTDPRVLTEHRTKLLSAMIVPDELTTTVPTTGRDSILHPTLLAPGFTLAAPVRVNGTVNAKYSTTDPSLEVTTNLVWAYALVPEADTVDPADNIVVLHEQMTMYLYPSDPTWKNKVWMEHDRAFDSNIDCGYVADGLIGLPRVDDPSRAPQPSGVIPTGNQPFDPKTPLDIGSSCL